MFKTNRVGITLPALDFTTNIKKYQGSDEINSELVIKGNDFIINVHYVEGFRTYLDFIDLKVPELSAKEPKLFNFFNHEYVGD